MSAYGWYKQNISVYFEKRDRDAAKMEMECLEPNEVTYPAIRETERDDMKLVRAQLGQERHISPGKSPYASKSQSSMVRLWFFFRVPIRVIVSVRMFRLYYKST